MTSGIYYPHFVVVDINDPVRNSLDTGGTPGPEMRLLLNAGETMRGVYDFHNVGIELRFGRGFDGGMVMPTVRLGVRRTPMPEPRA